MDAYAYNAALYCADCAQEIIDDCRAKGIADDGDTDGFPQGPFADGGGEADCPQHCDNCQCFLENPLTTDGVEYVREALADGSSDPEVESLWAEFYAAELDTVTDESRAFGPHSKRRID